MGEEAEDVLTSTGILEEDRKKYDKVVKKLDAFFKVRKNVIYERARFNQRNQGEGESVECYITALYQLVEFCEFGPLKDDLLRDRIVVGIRDKAVSQRMQLDSNLTLEKAKRLAMQSAAVKEQQGELQRMKGGEKGNPIVIDEIGKEKKRRKQPYKRGKDSGPHKGGAQGRTDQKIKPQCKRCGKKNHSSGETCPAVGAVCYKCNRKGHYSSQCFSKTVVPATADDPDLDSTFLGALESDNSWNITLLLGGQETLCKVDTGAEVTAITEQTFLDLKGEHILTKPSRILRGPTGQRLDVLGQFKGVLKKGEYQTKEVVYVVRGLKFNLLGLPAIRLLHLISEVNTTSGEEDWPKKFPALFKGLGTLGDAYTIKLQEGAQPHALFTPRNVPLPMREKVKQELERMQQAGIISKVEEHTPWCAGMVVVPKGSGEVRICVDLKALNENVLRECYPIPVVDDTLAQLSGATVFFKLDANSGFWQVPLSDESRLLTTFITPFGRYCFNKLPFGISSAPELFQCRMNMILNGLQGILCHMDDVLIYAATKEEHNKRLQAVLERLTAAGATLNLKKCEFNKSRIKFLGHIIDKDGIHVDPGKVEAVLKMDAPTDVSGLRRFLGMVQQLGKFIPNLSELTQPLRELLSAKRSWTWSSHQEEAFNKIKQELTNPTTLALYNPTAPTKVSTDASSFGLGAVLLQQHEHNWKPVAFASRVMRDTEKNYAQIEKEALATTWACEKFSNYILGKTIKIESDHKPVPLLNSKRLDNLPPRILRFQLRMARYSYVVEHVPGKLLYSADTLSRSPIRGNDNPEDFQEEVEVFFNAIVQGLPTTPKRLKEYKEAQDKDPVCTKVRCYCLMGWPEKKEVDVDIVPYWMVRSALTSKDGLLLYHQRIVVPRALQRETLNRIHEGHQGIEKCRMRSKSSVWWPGIAKQISNLVENCPTCVREAKHRREPLLCTDLPDYPWQVVGSDLFVLKETQYLLVVDYFSRYIEILQLSQQHLLTSSMP